MSASRLLTLYYAATAVFLVLDYAFGINVRVAALQPWPGLRAAYYGVLFACLGLVVWRPAWATAVGAVESLTTLVGLILGTALRTMLPGDDVLESGRGFASVPELVNFVVAGSIAYFSWHRSMTALFGPKR